MSFVSRVTHAPTNEYTPPCERGVAFRCASPQRAGASARLRCCHYSSLAGAGAESTMRLRWYRCFGFEQDRPSGSPVAARTMMVTSSRSGTCEPVAQREDLVIGEWTGSEQAGWENSSLHRLSARHDAGGVVVPACGLVVEVRDDEVRVEHVHERAASTHRKPLASFSRRVRLCGACISRIGTRAAGPGRG